MLSSLLGCSPTSHTSTWSISNVPKHNQLYRMLMSASGKPLALFPHVTIAIQSARKKCAYRLSRHDNAFNDEVELRREDGTIAYRIGELAYYSVATDDIPGPENG